MPSQDESSRAELADCRRHVIESGIGPGSSARIARTFDEKDIDAFGRISGDRNPYHFDVAFAADSRFGRPIAHGLMVAAMLTEIGGQWAWLATRMTFDFLAPVYAGDTVTLKVEVVSLSQKNFAEARATWTNQDGKIVLRGTLGGYPPTADQRTQLAAGNPRHTPE